MIRIGSTWRHKLGWRMRVDHVGLGVARVWRYEAWTTFVIPLAVFSSWCEEK